MVVFLVEKKEKTNLLRNDEVAFCDLLEHLHLALGLERRVAATHLEDQHADRPP